MPQQQKSLIHLIFQLAHEVVTIPKDIVEQHKEAIAMLTEIKGQQDKIQEQLSLIEEALIAKYEGEKPDDDDTFTPSGNKPATPPYQPSAQQPADPEKPEAVFDPSANKPAS